MGNHQFSSSRETFTPTHGSPHSPSPESPASRSRNLRTLYRNLNLSKLSFRSRRSSLIFESEDFSSSNSVHLLAFRPFSSSFYSTTPPSSNGSLKSVLSTTTNSSTGSTNFKRSARGRSQKRWSGYSEKVDGRHATAVEELKTAYPISVKEAVFLPQFPIRSKSSKMNKILTETPLSTGKFGHVSRVVVEGRKEEFALKRIRKDFVIRHRLTHQAKDEAVIQKSFCVHPFLVSAIDTWQTRSHLCILTEFVEGGDLSTLWHQHGAFPEEVVKIWGLEIGLALDHLHSRGILYRDLKLANTLLDSQGHIKLADFGLAKMLVDKEKRAKTICGTLNYMAPEILNEEEYEAAADWWSFGIVIYALLFGKYPVEPAEDHILMCEEVMRHRYFDSDSENEQISSAAVLLLDRLLRKNPVTRLQSLQAVRKQAFFCQMNLANVFRKVVSPFAILRTSVLKS